MTHLKGKVDRYGLSGVVECGSGRVIKLSARHGKTVVSSLDWLAEQPGYGTTDWGHPLQVVTKFWRQPAVEIKK